MKDFVTYRLWTSDVESAEASKPEESTEAPQPTGEEAA